MISRVPWMLRNARTASGLTQSELAGKLRTSQSAIARLEGPRSNPTVDMLERALLATGHRLEIAAAPSLPPVDEGQIASRLRMTPAERLAGHSAAYSNLRTLVRRTRPSVGGLG